MTEPRTSKSAIADRLSARERPRPAPPRLFQSGDPQHYTRFVTIMKRALLLTALALIAAVIAYSLQPREQNNVAMTFERISKVANDLAMIKPQLHGTNSAGNPFVVTADQAVQDGPNAHRARLVNVQADMTLKGGTWLTLNAANGLFDADKKTLKLNGAISAFSDSGYELHTDQADVDLAAGRMVGDHAVTGHGPLGTLSADSFVIDKTMKQVELMGHVKMVFYRHGSGGRT